MVLTSPLSPAVPRAALSGPVPLVPVRAWRRCVACPGPSDGGALSGCFCQGSGHTHTGGVIEQA